MVTLKTDFGFEGWERSPGFSEFATKVAKKCNMQFWNTYGTYYIAGQRNGNYMDVTLDVYTHSSEDVTSVSGELSGSWSDPTG